MKQRGKEVAVIVDLTKKSDLVYSYLLRGRLSRSLRRAHYALMHRSSGNSPKLS